MGGIPKGRVVYKCGATTYKTSGTVSHNTYNSTLSGVAFRNRVRVEGEFSKEGDSGGIVYTYANNEYAPCGIISSGAMQAPYFSVFVKASEIAYYLNVQPFLRKYSGLGGWL